MARALGIEHYASRLSPADKLAHVRSIQRQNPGVIMVGDGVNDAPVLAAAGVSIALQSGTALAQSSADLILFGTSLEALPRAIAVARRSHRVIRQNLIWAAIYNAVAIPLAALGWIAPWLAALGMSLSSIVVVLNARRIVRLARRLPDAPAAAPQRAEAAGMSILFVLIALGLLLMGIAVWAFFWAVDKGQFDDLDGPASSILDDHET